MAGLVTPPVSPSEVRAFWFEEVGSMYWFAKNKKLDDTLRSRFLSLHTMAAVGAIDEWSEAPDSALALIIVLDQFSRNLYRENSRSFAQDEKAISIAKQAVSKAWDQKMMPHERMFLYMPFMHAENIADQEQGCLLFKSLDLPLSLYSARLHHAVVERFGRFPHRNTYLGRQSTAEELDYLAKGGLRF